MRQTRQTAIGFLVELLWAARVHAFMLAAALRAGQARVYALLDERVFPRVLAYTTHRAHIALMLLLWLALLLAGGWTAFELVGGNYTNGLSALMTCIIALSQVHHRRENDAQHAATHAKLDSHEAKIDELHAHVTRRRNGRGTMHAAQPDQTAQE